MSLRFRLSDAQPDFHFCKRVAFSFTASESRGMVQRLNSPPCSPAGFKLFLARMGAVLLFAMLCGCSSFNRDWDRAAKTIPPGDSIEGRWEGRWISETNGHNGKLRCLMTRESETNYQARFRASYAGIFRF